MRQILRVSYVGVVGRRGGCLGLNAAAAGAVQGRFRQKKDCLWREVPKSGAMGRLNLCCCAGKVLEKWHLMSCTWEVAHGKLHMISCA